MVSSIFDISPTMYILMNSAEFRHSGSEVKTQLNALGIHLLLEYHNCDPAILNSLEKIRAVIIEAALASGATILHHSFHQFSPQGISGVVVIAESHIAIHTWPEHRFAAVDIFSCGTSVEPLAAHRSIEKGLKSARSTVEEINRGVGYEGEKREERKQSA